MIEQEELAACGFVSWENAAYQVPTTSLRPLALLVAGAPSDKDRPAWATRHKTQPGVYPFVACATSRWEAGWHTRNYTSLPSKQTEDICEQRSDVKSRRTFHLSYLGGLRSTMHLFARHCRLDGKAHTMADRPGACRASLTPDSSRTSNIGPPMHDLGVCSDKYHDSRSCPTHFALVHGITASKRTIALLDPLPSAYDFYSRCALVCLYILSTVPFSQAATNGSPKSVCLFSVQTYCFLHFCFTLNRSCGPAGHSHTWLVYSCLTHLAECKSPRLSGSQLDNLPAIPAHQIYAHCVACRWMAHGTKNDRDAGRVKYT